MQVNVFVSEVAQDGSPTTMLALPIDPFAAVPKHLRGTEWRYLATADAGDPVLGTPASEVEAAIVSHGYFVTTPKRDRLPGRP